MRNAHAVAVLAVLACTGCGSASHPSAATPASGADVPARTATRAAQRATRVVVRSAGRLPAAVQDPATTALPPDGAMLFGGLDQADTSVASIVRITGRRARVDGTLPSALHDAAAATIGGRAYLFGGGNLGSSAAILRSGRSQAGALPVPASDVAATTVGRSVYIVGGYDGTNPLDTIVSWRPGGAAHVVAHLPRPLRYAAVAAVDGRLIIAGGTSGVVAQRAILAFDPATRRVSRIGRLAQPTTHAAAGVLGGHVIVIGGRGPTSDAQSRIIVAIDPATGDALPAGRLPRALSDAGAATLGSRILVAGGRDRTGTVRDELYDVTLAG